MADARNALASRDSHIWSLRIAMVVLMIIISTLVYVIHDRDQNQKLHIPPDLSQGATVKLGELNPANAYMFGSLTWSKINEWRTSGKDDYLKKIEEFDCKITPRFRNWLKKDYELKAKQGELSRQRFMRFRGYYKPGLAKTMGQGFVVGLEMDVVEEIKREQFKTRGIFYPMAVVRDNRSCNDTGMALDGFYSEPYQIVETNNE